MLKKTFPVFDFDAHINDPIDIWDKYVEPEYREAVRNTYWRDDDHAVLNGRTEVMGGANNEFPTYNPICIAGPYMNNEDHAEAPADAVDTRAEGLPGAQRRHGPSCQAQRDGPHGWQRRPFPRGAIARQTNRQERRGGMMQYNVISADSHVNSPPDIYTSRLTGALADRAPRVEETSDGILLGLRGQEAARHRPGAHGWARVQGLPHRRRQAQVR